MAALLIDRGAYLLLLVTPLSPGIPLPIKVIKKKIFSFFSSIILVLYTLSKLLDICNVG